MYSSYRLARNRNMFGPRLRPKALKTPYLGTYFLISCILFTADIGAALSLQNEEEIPDIIGKMKAAYAGVEDYQTETEVKVYSEGEVETERFLYTFKKPNHIRVDLKSPRRGTILIFPDENGKVAVKPSGLFGFLKLHISPENALLKTAAGQRIDQTDLGLLIQNIDHSLTDRRYGEVKVSERAGRVLIEVLAEDHFRAGVLTRYHFSVDETNWLPVEVREFTPDGILKREVIFRNLRTSIGIPDSFFRIDGKNPEHEQSGG